MWPSVVFATHRVARKSEDFSSAETIAVFGVPLMLFGVFDGHGGQQTALELRASFSKVFIEEMDRARALVTCAHARDAFEACLEPALISTFGRLDAECKARFAISGSTATVVLIALEESRPLPSEDAHRVCITIANVGDSHAILDSDCGVQFLSTDHRAGKIKSELKRIEAAGGTVEREDAASPLRLYPGGLMVTRTIGDAGAPQASCIPAIRHVWLRIDKAQGGARLIIASDGLWDAIAEKEAASLVRSKRAAAAASQFLVKEASRREGRNGDDVTVFVVDLADTSSSHWMPTTILPPATPRLLKWSGEDKAAPALVLATRQICRPRPSSDWVSPSPGSEVVIGGSKINVAAVEGGMMLLSSSNQWISSNGWKRHETVAPPRTAAQEDADLVLALEKSLAFEDGFLQKPSRSRARRPRPEQPATEGVAPPPLPAVPTLAVEPTPEAKPRVRPPRRRRQPPSAENAAAAAATEGASEDVFITPEACGQATPLAPLLTSPSSLAPPSKPGSRPNGPRGPRRGGPRGPMTSLLPDPRGFVGPEQQQQPPLPPPQQRAKQQVPRSQPRQPPHPPRAPRTSPVTRGPRPEPPLSPAEPLSPSVQAGGPPFVSNGASTPQRWRPRPPKRRGAPPASSQGPPPPSAPLPASS